MWQTFRAYPEKKYSTRGQCGAIFTVTFPAFWVWGVAFIPNYQIIQLRDRGMCLWASFISCCAGIYAYVTRTGFQYCSFELRAVWLNGVDEVKMCCDLSFFL